MGKSNCLYYQSVKRVAHQDHRAQLFLDKLRREHPGWKAIQHQEWGLFLLGRLFHNTTAIWRKEWQQYLWRHPYPQQTNTAEEMAPEYPSVITLLGSPDQEILDVAKWVYRGQYKVAPSVLPHRLQDHFMARLHEELGKWLVRASLLSVTATAWSLSRERRHSQAHSSSWTSSPSEEGRMKDIAKQPRSDSLSRSLWPHNRGHRSRVQQHQSQLPEHQQESEVPPWAFTRPYRCTLPSPSLPH